MEAKRKLNETLIYIFEKVIFECADLESDSHLTCNEAAKKILEILESLGLLKSRGEA